MGRRGLYQGLAGRALRARRQAARHRRWDKRDPPDADRPRIDRRGRVIWLWLSAAFMVTTAGVHSVPGYRRLIVPLLRGEAGSLADHLTRRIIRFAMHAPWVLRRISAAPNSLRDRTVVVEGRGGERAVKLRERRKKKKK